MKHENYIITKYTKEIELSELDFDLDCDILGTDDFDDKEHIVIENGNKYSYAGESTPIKIDAMIKTLEELKQGGANYVEVVFHCDHHGYVFNGAKITKATPEEINEHEISEKRNELQEKLRKATILQQELDKLNEELNG